MLLLKEFLINELKIDDNIIYEKFLLFNDLILEWNSKINVISRKNVSIENIVLNSIFFLKRFDFNPKAKVLDIGTGGGFPGIPLKILFPHISIVLCDSIKKKITVVEDTIVKLGFQNAEALCSRAEELYKGKKTFDYIVSKSVAPLNNLYEWANSLLNKNGKFLCIKGGDILNETNDIKKRFRKIEVDVIDFSFNQRYNIEDKKLVVIKKIL